jgi:hypothetical protein
MSQRLTCLLGAALLLSPSLPAEEKEPAGLRVDKKERTVTIDCLVAPRKLEKLDKIYPIEVIATFPKGEKVHETVVTYTAKPSAIHKALEELGLKAGKPALGKGQVGRGPEVAISLEVPTEGGKSKLVPIEESMVNMATGKTLPKMRWLFTGSVFTYPDPEKDDKIYGADQSGTLITIFPVTDKTVFQTDLKFEQQEDLRLETNPKVVPKIGTPVKIVIQVK